MRLLLELGADVHADAETFEASSRGGPLDVMMLLLNVRAKSNDVVLSSYILDNLAQLAAGWTAGETGLDMKLLLEYGAGRPFLDDPPHPALLAIQKGNIQIVELLLEEAVSPQLIKSIIQGDRFYDPIPSTMMTWLEGKGIVDLHETNETSEGS
jgi:hypothetical protein